MAPPCIGFAHNLVYVDLHIIYLGTATPRMGRLICVTHARLLVAVGVAQRPHNHNSCR